MNGQTDSSYTHDIFLSHNSNDKAVVEKVGAFLASNGVRVWFDQWEIDFGQSMSAEG